MIWLCFCCQGRASPSSLVSGCKERWRLGASTQSRSPHPRGLVPLPSDACSSTPPKRVAHRCEFGGVSGYFRPAWKYGRALWAVHLGTSTGGRIPRRALESFLPAAFGPAMRTTEGDLPPADLRDHHSGGWAAAGEWPDLMSTSLRRPEWPWGQCCSRALGCGQRQAP